MPSSTREAGAPAASTPEPPKANLIARFKLEERLNKEANAATSSIDPGGKAAWEDSVDRREASLRERKAQMVLAARK
jgi:coupling of ubiquitin conjugation to ER degradation protein 1